MRVVVEGLSKDLAMLVLDGVYKSFSSGKGASSKTPILEDISFSVEEGEIVSMIGPTGCGKTTLLRIIDGIIRADEGRILIGGTEVKAEGDPRCALVFQNFNLFPWRNAIRNTEFGLESKDVSADERRKRAGGYLEMVGLKGYERYHPHELSGGMQQRVGLARALTVEPSIILFDEPFGSVDVLRKEQLQAEVLKILLDRRKTAVFVTHDIDEAIFLSDRVISLSSHPGRVKNIFDVKLPRPRDPEILGSEEANRLLERMRRDLYESLQADTQGYSV